MKLKGVGCGRQTGSPIFPYRTSSAVVLAGAVGFKVSNVIQKTHDAIRSLRGSGLQLGWLARDSEDLKSHFAIP